MMSERTIRLFMTKKNTTKWTNRGMQIKKGSGGRSRGDRLKVLKTRRNCLSFRLDYIVTLTSFPFLTKHNNNKKKQHSGLCPTILQESGKAVTSPQGFWRTSVAQGPEWERTSDRHFLSRAEPGKLKIKFKRCQML